MPSFSPALYSSWLRREISQRNKEYAETNQLQFELSLGESPVMLYLPTSDTHGNFLPATYAAILGNADWRRRLNKSHTHSRLCLPASEHKWKELDSACSSDALLMNVFCHPDCFTEQRLPDLLGLEELELPQFGYRPRVPLANGTGDRTEVDLRLGKLLIEAKLTEGDFTRQKKPAVESYRDFGKVFEPRRLPQDKNYYFSYQLIRNVLAAHATEASFCVLQDARRPDLHEAWFAVISAVQSQELRRRCKVLTWQELAEALPTELQEFLLEKYGIRAGAPLGVVFQSEEEFG